MDFNAEMPSSLAKHRHSTKLDEAVFKATQSKPVPPKAKHERSILVETWNNRSARYVFEELFKRPLGGKDIVLFKTLIIVHKVMRFGHPQSIEDLTARKDFMESLRSQSSNAQNTMASIDEAYVAFLLAKLGFHKKFPEINGEISLQKYKEKNRKFNSKNTLALVTALLELQKATILLETRILQSQGLNEMRLAAIVTCVPESYSIYTMTEYFLKKLVEYEIETDIVSDLVEQFELQYPMLQKFFFTVGTIPYVTKEVAVPQLPTNPPHFRVGTVEKKAPKPKKENTGPLDVDILNSQAGRPPAQAQIGFNFASLTGSGSGAASYGNNTFGAAGYGATGIPGFGSVSSGFGSGATGAGGFGAGTAGGFGTSSGGFTGSSGGYTSSGGYNSSGLTGSSGGFGTGSGSFGSGSGGYGAGSASVGFGAGSGSYLGSGSGSAYGAGSSNAFNQGALTNSTGGADPSNPFGTSTANIYTTPQAQISTAYGNTTSANPFAQESFSNTYGSQPLNDQTNLQQGGNTRDVLQQQIRDLEIKIGSLESTLKSKRDENTDLKSQLGKRDGGLANVRSQMEERLSQQQKQFMDTNAALKAHLEQMVGKYEKEKRALLTDQIDFAKRGLDQNMHRFDDPNNKGNQTSNGDDVLRDADDLAKAYDSLFSTINNEGDVVGAARVLSETASRIMNDAKGVASRIDNPDIKLDLSEGARNVGHEASRMIGHAKQLAPQGKPDERQAEFLNAERNRFLQNILNVKKSMTDSQRQLESSATTTDLEGLAERELLNAAKMIEDAARALLAENSRRKIRVKPGELDVEGSIMEAAMAVATATQMIVNAAAAAQQERVKKGLTDKSERYHSDPMWTEGLISAAKAVAESTRQLVVFANKAAQGQIDDSALIAASKSVAASTAQLISATRSKSVAGSQTQAALDVAASSVKKATNQLVDAAKSFASSEELEMMKKSDSFATSVKAEMDQSALITRVEKELNDARQELFNMRKGKYAEAQTPRSGVSPRPGGSPRPPTVTQNSASAVDTTSYTGVFGNNPNKPDDEANVKLPAYMMAKVDKVPTRITPQSQPFPQPTFQQQGLPQQSYQQGLPQQSANPFLNQPQLPPPSSNPFL